MSEPINCNTCFYDSPTGRCRHPGARKRDFYKITPGLCYEAREEVEDPPDSFDLGEKPEECCVHPGMSCGECGVGA